MGEARFSPASVSAAVDRIAAEEAEERRLDELDAEASDRAIDEWKASGEPAISSAELRKRLNL
jgi:hypothetical protein